MKILKRKRKRHVHTPLDPVAINILRAHVASTDQKLRWRCVCGEMVEDDN